MNENLVAFFYLLMRDHLPTGAVVDVVKVLEEKHDPIVFTSKHLEAYARELVERLVKNYEEKE